MREQVNNPSLRTAAEEECSSVHLLVHVLLPSISLLLFCFPISLKERMFDPPPSFPAGGDSLPSVVNAPAPNDELYPEESSLRQGPIVVVQQQGGQNSGNALKSYLQPLLA
jgi:hypothetical protein